VCNNTGLVYYGSTTQKYLSARLEQHRQVYQTCTSRKILNGGNYDILLVENVNCNSKDELRARERFYIENNDCVNKNIPGRTRKEWCEVNKDKLDEYQKEWRNENKEKISESSKKYNQDNKEKVSEQKKKYRLDNKDKIAERGKKYRNENKEKISESSKKYYQKNKDKISEQKKNYRIENKEKIAEQQKIKITCSCGSTYTKYHKNRHEKSKKHREFIQNHSNSVLYQDSL
jgi:hypothetical protein